MTARNASSCLNKKIHTKFSTYHKVHSDITEKKSKGQKVSSGKSAVSTKICYFRETVPKKTILNMQPQKMCLMSLLEG